MAWGDQWPADAGFNPFSYETHIQLWLALSERRIATANQKFPQHVTSIDSGEVYLVTAIPGTGNYLFDLSDADGNPKSYDYVSSTSPFNGVFPRPDPPLLDLIVETGTMYEPKKVVRLQVQEIKDPPSSELVVAGVPLDNAIAGNTITTLSDLLDKPFYLAARNVAGNYSWWHERLPMWPNDPGEDWRGGITSATQTTLVADGAGWTTDAFAGHLLWWNDSGGLLRKATITANTEDTLTFSSISLVPEGEFIITPSDAAATRITTPSQDAMNRWYRGLLFGGHLSVYQAPGQAWTTIQHPVTSYTWFGFPAPTTGVNVNPFDDDWIVPFSPNTPSEYVHPPNFILGPDLFKSFRGVQLAIEEMCGGFIPPREYNGEAEIPTYSTASLFRDADVGHHGEVIGTVQPDGVVTLFVPDIYVGSNPPEKTLHWRLHYGTVHILNSGGAEPYRAGGLYRFELGDTRVGQQLTLTYSWGWTRQTPREFRVFYAKKFFLPDDNQYPPTEALPGSWIVRPASTAYHEFLQSGDSAETDPILDGHTARFVGDNIADAEVTQFHSGEYDAELTPWYEKGTVGSFPPAEQAAIEAQYSGTLTAAYADGRILLDESKHWYDYPGWYTGNVGGLKEHVGTSTAGTAGTLIDAAPDEPAFWAVGDRFVDMILEVEIDAGSGIYERRPIIASNTTTITVAWDFSGTCSGKAYRIVEPKYEAGRFKGRTLTLIKPDDSEITVQIIGSDDQLLYTAEPSEPPEAGWRYRIEEPITGTLWNRSGGVWNEVSGSPDRVTRYGRICKNDYLPQELFNEMYRSINFLVWTFGGLDWNDHFDPELEDRMWPDEPPGHEKMYHGGGVQVLTETPWTTLVGTATSDWFSRPDEYTISDQGGGGNDGENPHAEFVGVLAYILGGGDPVPGSQLAAERVAAYPHSQVQHDLTHFSPQVDAYVFADVNRDYLESPGPRDTIVFNANGAGVIENRYARIATGLVVNSSDGSGRLSGPLFNGPPAAIPLSPVAPDPGDPPVVTQVITYRGWRLYGQLCVFRYNIADGSGFRFRFGEDSDFAGAGQPPETIPTDPPDWDFGIQSEDPQPEGETAWFWCPP